MDGGLWPGWIILMGLLSKNEPEFSPDAALSKATSIYCRAVRLPKNKNEVVENRLFEIFGVQLCTPLLQYQEDD